jgi:NADH:ubiquinone oxidoreductase subunit K
MSLSTVVFVVVIGLIGIALYALLATRNLIKVIVALQLLVKGAILALVLAGRLSGQVDLGQSIGLTVIVADTIVAVIGLALAVQIRRYCGSLDLKAHV